MEHKIKIFSAKSESRLTDLVNEWLEENNIVIIDIKFSMTSNLMSSGRETHTYSALIYYTHKLYRTGNLNNFIERRGDK